jgi:CubicO group peptidase (beta-lactamase class C family)
MRSQHIAGLSVGVARSGRTLYERGYGERDVLRHLPARADTVYRIGSLTKAFTARAIATLANKGKLGLDRPAARYLPRFPWSGEVTVRDLLAQRSGIPSYTDDPALNPYAWYAPSQLSGAVAHQPLQFAPGTRFAYSNTNYVLLGMIAQRVGGEEYEDFINRHVVAPMHLRHTRYGDQPGEALGYTWDGGAFVRATPSSPAYAFSAAAMTSNVPDLLHFLDTVHAPYYGLLQDERIGGVVWYASGNVDGYSAFAFIVPQTGDEAVILCNADRVDLAPLALDILHALEPPAAQIDIGPAQNEDPAITSQMRQRASALFEPLRIALLEFLSAENTPASRTVTYRATLSDGSRMLLRAPLSADGKIGDITIIPLN